MAVEADATATLEATGAARWISFDVTETTEETFRQEKRGRPGADTRYRKQTRTHHRVAWHVNEDIVTRDAASDGCFPLITNDETMTPAEVLAAYRYQPNLERRNHMLKGPNKSTPSTSTPRTASKPSCSASSSPYSPKPSSNARSERP